MALEVGKAYVGVMPDLKGFGAKLAAGINAEGKLGAMTGGQMAAAAFGVAFTGAVAIGTGLYKIAEEVDAGVDKIRVGTGATGKELEKLKGDLMAVTKTGPEPFDVVGTAIVGLSTRLGLTGKPLQDLSRQILDLSRITGTDVSANVESLTRMFGDAGIKAEDYGTALDGVFRASQATNVPLGQLSDLMVKFGAPMRQFGFSMEESAVLLGKFQKEGVNTELVMGSMRIALGKFADAGRDPKQALQETIAEIKRLGPGAEATSLAMDTFGKRAGADMAAAIQEGKFEISDLFAKVSDGTDTIKKASDATKDFPERLAELRNQMKVALEPAATKLFDALGKTVEAMGPTVTVLAGAFGKVAEVFAGIPTPVLLAAAAFATAIATILTIKSAFDKVQAAWSAVSAVFAINPVVLALLAIVAIIALVVWKWDWLKENVPKAWDKIKEATAAAWEWIKDFFAKFWPYLLGAIFGPIGLIVAYLVTHWDQVKEKTAAAWGWVRDHIAAVWETIKLWVGEKVAAVRDAVANTFDNIRDRVTGAMSALWNFLMAPFRWISDQAGKVGDAVRNIADRFESVRDRVAGAVAGLIGWITGFVDSAKAKLKELKDWIASNLSNLLGPLAGPLAGIARLFGGGGGGGGRGGGRASGGDVQAGKDYLVGENGPELVRLGQSGTVTTAHATRRLLEAVAAKAGGGGGMNVAGPLVAINGDVVVRSDQDITDLSRQLAKDINRLARAQGTNIALTGSMA